MSSGQENKQIYKINKATETADRKNKASTYYCTFTALSLYVCLFPEENY